MVERTSFAVVLWDNTPMDLPGSPSQSPVLPKSGRPEASSRGCNRLGRYLVVGRLGQGGMGVVYEAEDTLLKRRVAVKLLPREVAANAEALKRFLREGRAAAGLNHPNVVAVYDIGEANGTYYIVMELVRGGSAQDALRTRGRFHWTEATGILMDVCRGAAAAHKAGLVHRDIKPANILRSEDGVVKLADFGLVKTLGRKGTVVTALGGIVGTPHYMSPEQSRGGVVDERSDVYALGAVYFALLAGRPPFENADSVQVLFAHCTHPVPDPRQIVPDIPEACTTVIRKAMAKDRSHRHAGAGELLADLERIASTPAPQAVPRATFVWSKPDIAAPSLADAYPGERTDPEIAPKKRRRPIAVAILLVAVAVTLSALLLRGRDGPEEKEDWPSLSSAADRAVRARDAAAMKRVADDIRVLLESPRGRDPDVQDAARRTLTLLEKAREFRERITEKGLILSMDGQVTSVAFSPDDRLLAAGQVFGDGGALVWDGLTGERLHTLWPRGKDAVKVQAVAFSHDSTALAVGGTDPAVVRVRRIADGTETTLSPGAGVNRVLSLAFSPTTRVLTAGLEPVTEGRGRPYLKCWDIDTGLEPWTFKAEHSARIRSVTYCTGGQQVASGSQDGRVVVWNAVTGRIVRELHPRMVVHSISCAPQGNTFAVAGGDGNASVLQFWDHAADRLLSSEPSPHGACRCTAFTRDGALMASGSGSRILLWNPETRQRLGTLTGHDRDVTSLAFSADGSVLATGSEDQTTRLWDVTRFRPARPGP